MTTTLAPPSTLRIRQLFASKIDRTIDEVIKVDQDQQDIVKAEIEEYVVTDAIRAQFTQILERYAETPNKPHEGTAVWISGFFGSGKSSFAKLLGLTLANRAVAGEGAAERLAPKLGGAAQALLSGILKNIPTEAVIFDVASSRHVKTPNQSITEIIYRLFLKQLGYAEDLDLAELEITLEKTGRLPEFEQRYQAEFQEEWNKAKHLPAFALSQASQVMHLIDAKSFPEKGSFLSAARGRADLNAVKLAERAKELMDRRHPGKTLVVVVDEVGQFVARDVRKMLDLQGVAEQLGKVSRGKHWLVVTSQERLQEVVGGIDDKRVELARLRDRFPNEVHLEPSDIAEVTSKRVLAKNAEAQKALHALFDEHRGRLVAYTRLSAEYKLPELDAASFVSLYPLLPYHVDLIISVVSGLRTQGGASKHVGGANRTIIKLAQQLLIHERTKVADQPLGALVTLDMVYDLIESNIDSSLRQKISGIVDKVGPYEQRVAKVVCLLQFVKAVHPTAANLAAALHPAVDADSELSKVQDALKLLEQAGMVRQAEAGVYRIPSPIEDDWEKERREMSVKEGDRRRVYASALAAFWSPVPRYNFKDARVFEAGLFLDGKLLQQGDLAVHVEIALPGELEDEAAKVRVRSQQEKKALFWVVAREDAVEREAEELVRSEQMIAKRERTVHDKDVSQLLTQEKRRRKRHDEEVRRLLRQACLRGKVYFQGNDRSPGDDSDDVGKVAAKLLAQALPVVFDRFEDAAARVTQKDLDALTTSENLKGLTPVFSALKLLKDEKGNKTVLRTDGGPLHDVFAWVKDQYSYGKAPNGKAITDQFGAEPYGWPLDAVKLFCLALLRAGQVEVTSKSHTIESALSIDAKEAFQNNTSFRAASFKPRSADDLVDMKTLLDASEAFRGCFGKDLKELQQGPAAQQIREQAGRHEDRMQEVYGILAQEGLPSAELLAEGLSGLKSLRTGSEKATVTSFVGSHATLKDAIARAAKLSDALVETNLHTLRRGKDALERLWSFLQKEPELPPELAERAEELADILKRDDFYTHLPKVDQHAKALHDAYAARLQAAVQARAAAYAAALERLHGLAEWAELDEASRPRIEAALAQRAGADVPLSASIPLLREETHACTTKLQQAEREVLQVVDSLRLVELKLSDFLAGSLETDEQVNEFVERLRAELLKQVGAKKKVLLH
jgi:hypothetical protein